MKHGEAAISTALEKGCDRKFSEKENHLLGKADELRSEFGCDIYSLGRRNGKLFNYTFIGGILWPLSLIEVVSGFRLIQGRI